MITVADLLPPGHVLLDLAATTSRAARAARTARR